MCNLFSAVVALDHSTQDLATSLQCMQSGLGLEKVGVATKGSCTNQSYHPPCHYMCVYAILCGGSRDILGEIWALYKLTETLQVLTVKQDFLPTDVLREAVVTDTSKKQGDLLRQGSSRSKGW